MTHLRTLELADDLVLHDIPAVAQLLDCPEGRVRRLIDSGKLGSCRYGGRRYVADQQIHAYTESLK